VDEHPEARVLIPLARGEAVGWDVALGDGDASRSEDDRELDHDTAEEPASMV
jgi:hypothetical protein